LRGRARIDVEDVLVFIVDLRERFEFRRANLLVTTIVFSHVAHEFSVKNIIGAGLLINEYTIINICQPHLFQQTKTFIFI
jgi:hypothetical protein